MKKFFLDKKNQLIFLLSILFLIEAPHEDIRFTLWVLGGVLLAAIADFLIKYLFFKQKIIPNSAIISGFIVAGILDYHRPWFILVIFSFLAIVSKNIIKFKKHHIFNPANFALFVATIFRIPLTWNIESNIYLIIACGLYFAYSLKKIPHVLGFLSIFTALFLTQGISSLLFVSCFFVFVMLIEPKTSGFGSFRGFIFGSIVGVVSFLIFKFFPQYNFFVGALFIANLFNPILEKIKK